MLKLSLMAHAIALACVAWDAHAQPADAPPPAPPSPGAPAAATLEPVEVTTTRARLDAARNQLSPDTGSSVYRFDARDLNELPLGDATPLNQVLLRAPGVVQDASGQLHVRGDHANLQYRIDGVVIPEAITGFGQALDTRFASRISVLTGALPAQYGYRTAGVVDLHTKGDGIENGGNVELVGGTHDHREGSAQLGGSVGAWSYFMTGSVLRDDVGLENPTAARDAQHDRTHQRKGFGYFSYLIDETSRINVIVGASDNRFQIPDVPGQAAPFTLASTPTPASSALDANQREGNRFEVLSYQSSVRDAIDYQVAAFRRVTDVRYAPDPVGDLVYNGVAATIVRRNEVEGVQADASRRVGQDHTLRFGFFGQRERARVDDTAVVFPADASGAQTSTTPRTIVDNARLDGGLWGVYLQDEWQVTPAFTVNAGARYDRVSTVAHEQQLSPRLGFVYDWSDRTRFHAGVARYFTPPPTEKIDTTSIAAFAGTTNAVATNADTNVKSERSTYYDIGVSHVLTPALTLGFDAYARDVRHLQDEGQFGNALIYSAFNYAHGRIAGVELSATYRDARWSGYANLALSSARARGIETGQFHFAQDELEYIATHWVHLDHDQIVAASTGGALRVDDATRVGVDALYGSGLRRGFANTQHLPRYVQVDAYASRSVSLGAWGTLDTRVSVLNVFDRSYALRDGSGIGVGAPQFGPRRTLLLSVSKPFGF